MRTRIVAAIGVACALSCASTSIAQDEFTPVAESPVIERDVHIVANALEAVGVSKGTVARLDVPEEVRVFEMNVPILDEIMTIRMEPYSVRADNFRLVRQLPDGTYIDVEPDAPRTMRGEIMEMPGTKVAGSISEEGFTGVIHIPTHDMRLWVEPVSTRARGASRLHHVLYEDTDILNAGGTCGTNDDMVIGPMPVAEQGTARGAGCSGICVTEIACDMDVEWNNDFGGNGVGEIEDIINGLNIQYESQVGITHLIVIIVERTGPTDSDPYTDPTPDAGQFLSQFSQVWNAGFQDVQRDIAHLFSGKNFNGTTIGIAPVGVICNVGAAYSIVQNISNFACRTDLSAHELGHNWNALHCSGGCNTTMNSGLVCANSFNQGSINAISNFRNTRSCLTTFESGTAALPFQDQFPTNTLSDLLWTGIDGVVVNQDAINEPSPSFAMNLDGGGGDEIRSARLDASLEQDVIVLYSYQRTGGGDSPEPGEDLVAEYFNDMNNWIEIGRHDGGGPDETAFTDVMVELPEDAEHANLRIRFRNESSSGAGFDDWYVDDVAVTSTAALPGSFSLTTPPDGATGIGTIASFAWTASTDALSYNLIVDNDSDFSSPVLDTSISSTFFFNPGVSLQNNTQHFWSVTAINPNGSTPSSPVVGTFTVGMVANDCPGDCTDNGTVDFSDLVSMLGQFGTPGSNPGCDADDTGTVDFSDLVAALGLFGPCP